MNTIDKHKAVITEIFSHDYYVERFLRVVTRKYPNTNERIEDETNLSKICSFWNEFWFELPDSPSIHCGPFYMICDLAEGSYLEEPEYHED